MGNNIFIIGPMGAGKTSAGRDVAAQLGRRFLDSDRHVAKSSGRNAAEMAATFGVAELHALERGFARSQLSTADEVVVAAAASVADDEPLLAMITDSGCLLVHIDVNPLLVPQLANEGDHRRPMKPEAAVKAYHQRRARAVTAGAICVARSDGVDAVANRIVELAAIPRSSS